MEVEAGASIGCYESIAAHPGTKAGEESAGMGRTPVAIISDEKPESNGRRAVGVRTARAKPAAAEVSGERRKATKTPAPCQGCARTKTAAAKGPRWQTVGRGAMPFLPIGQGTAGCGRFEQGAQTCRG